ncbi:hypothetical protein VKT23_017332 [Stygiomarasmius scandens]|uniref:CCHC-type domain-containing protein n=1 Tax=Marasmiellus scandens TaxID=2682957 RepID=A0ABR1IU86_9AGAR
MTTTSTRTPDMMPLMGQKGAPPKFKGSYGEVHKFLRKYEQVCTSYNLTEAQKCENIVDYTSHKVSLIIEGFKGYGEKKWDKLKGEVIKHFDAARRDNRHKTKDLRKLVKETKHQKIRSLSDWRHYQRKFAAVGGWLLNHHKIDDKEYLKQLWFGIDSKFRKHTLGPDLKLKEPKTTGDPWSEDVINKYMERYFARGTFEEEESDSESDSSDDSSSDSDSDSSDSDSYDSDSSSDSDRGYKYSRKKRNSKTLKGKGPTKKKTKAPRNSSKDSSTSIEKATQPSSKNEVEDLIDQLSKMSIDDPQYSLTYYKAIKLDPECKSFLTAPAMRTSTVRNTFPRSNPFRNDTPRDLPPHLDPTSRLPPRQCYGCGEVGHGLRYCPKLNELVKADKVTMDPNGRYVMKGTGQSIRRNYNETMVQAYERMMKESTHQTNFIAEINPYTSEDESYNVGYESDIEPDDSPDDDDDDIEVLAADRTNKSINQARKQVFDGVHLPPKGSTSQKAKTTNRNQLNHQQEMPRQYRTRAQDRPNLSNKVPVVNTPTPNIPDKPVPMDVRKPRFNPNDTKDIEMKEPITPTSNVTPNHTSGTKQEATKPPATKENTGVIPRTKDLSTQIENKRQPRQAEIAKDINSEQILKSILSTPVTVTMHDLLGTSKDLSDQMLELLRRKNVKPIVAHSYQTSEVKGFLILLDIVLPKGSVRAIVDTGSQLNIMKKSIYESYVMRPVDMTRRVVMRDANGGTKVLTGLSSNVELECGNVSTQGKFWLGEKLPFDVLLGRPWQLTNLVSVEERVEGTYLVFRKRDDPEYIRETCVGRPQQITPVPYPAPEFSAFLSGTPENPDKFNAMKEDDQGELSISLCVSDTKEELMDMPLILSANIHDTITYSPDNSEMETPSSPGNGGPCKTLDLGLETEVSSAKIPISDLANNCLEEIPIVNLVDNHYEASSPGLAMATAFEETPTPILNDNSNYDLETEMPSGRTPATDPANNCLQETSSPYFADPMRLNDETAPVELALDKWETVPCGDNHQSLDDTTQTDNYPGSNHNYYTVGNSKGGEDSTSFKPRTQLRDIAVSPGINKEKTLNDIEEENPTVNFVDNIPKKQQLDPEVLAKLEKSVCIMHQGQDKETSELDTQKKVQWKSKIRKWGHSLKGKLETRTMDYKDIETNGQKLEVEEEIGPNQARSQYGELLEKQDQMRKVKEKPVQKFSYSGFKTMTKRLMNRIGDKRIHKGKRKGKGKRRDPLKSSEEPLTKPTHPTDTPLPPMDYTSCLGASVQPQIYATHHSDTVNYADPSPNCSVIINEFPFVHTCDSGCLQDSDNSMLSVTLLTGSHTLSVINGPSMIQSSQHSAMLTTTDSGIPPMTHLPAHSTFDSGPFSVNNSSHGHTDLERLENHGNSHGLANKEVSSIFMIQEDSGNISAYVKPDLNNVIHAPSVDPVPVPPLPRPPEQTYAHPNPMGEMTENSKEGMEIDAEGNNREVEEKLEHYFFKPYRVGPIGLESGNLISIFGTYHLLNTPNEIFDHGGILARMGNNGLIVAKMMTSSRPLLPPYIVDIDMWCEPDQLEWYIGQFDLENYPGEWRIVPVPDKTNTFIINPSHECDETKGTRTGKDLWHLLRCNLSRAYQDIRALDKCTDAIPLKNPSNDDSDSALDSYFKDVLETLEITRDNSEGDAMVALGTVEMEIDDDDAKTFGPLLSVSKEFFSEGYSVSDEPGLPNSTDYEGMKLEDESLGKPIPLGKFDNRTLPDPEDKPLTEEAEIEELIYLVEFDEEKRSRNSSLMPAQDKPGPPPSLIPYLRIPPVPGPTLFFELHTDQKAEFGTLASNILLREHSLLNAQNRPGAHVMEGVLRSHPIPTWVYRYSPPLNQQEFTGIDDNHPLRPECFRDKQAGLPIIPELLEEGYETMIHDKYLYMLAIIDDGPLLPEMWNAKDGRGPKRNVKLITDARQEAEPPSHDPEANRLYIERCILDSSKKHLPLSDQPNANLPPHWDVVYQELQEFLGEEAYHEPLEDSRKIVKGNVWLPRIGTLRKARGVLVNLLRDCVFLVLRPEWREAIERLPPANDTYHYFYKHCHYFRLMKLGSNVDRGFAEACRHMTTNPHGVKVERLPECDPTNSLVTVQEDEFLYHLILLLGYGGRESVARVIRKVRNLKLILGQEVRQLLVFGYLNPVAAYDVNGTPFPMRWDLGTMAKSPPKCDKHASVETDTSKEESL